MIWGSYRLLCPRRHPVGCRVISHDRPVNAADSQWRRAVWGGHRPDLLQVPGPGRVADRASDDREKVQQAGTAPMATAESRAAVATPRLSSPIRARQRTDPAAARSTSPSLSDGLAAGFVLIGATPLLVVAPAALRAATGRRSRRAGRAGCGRARLPAGPGAWTGRVRAGQPRGADGVRARSRANSGPGAQRPRRDERGRVRRRQLRAGQRRCPGSRSGTAVPAIGLDQLHGNGFLTLLAGRAPAGPHEITLGPRTLRELGLRIGQRVEVGANDRITPMRIVARRSSQRSAWAAARTSTPAGRTRNAAKHSSPCCSTGPKARPRQ